MIEFFGGIGAPMKALHNLSKKYNFLIKSIDYVDIDRDAVATYNALYPRELYPYNVVNYSARADILVHGSPCQDYSNLGKRLGGEEGSGTRSSLMFDTIDAIDKMDSNKPPVVVWENVKGAIDENHYPTFIKYVEAMGKMGYKTTWKVLDSRDFGLPQARERVYAVSVLSDDIEFTFDTLNESPMKNIWDFIETDVDSRYTIRSEKMINRISNIVDDDYAVSLIPIKDYCYTITNQQYQCPNAGIIPIGDGQYRILTERECWRLQGFTDKDFDTALTVHPMRGKMRNGTLYRHAGNTMSVPVIEAVIEGCINQGFINMNKEDIVWE